MENANFYQPLQIIRPPNNGANRRCKPPHHGTHQDSICPIRCHTPSGTYSSKVVMVR